MEQLQLPFNMDSEHEKLAKELTEWQYDISSGYVIYYYESLLKRIQEVGLDGWYVEETEDDPEWGCILWNGENLA